MGSNAIRQFEETHSLLDPPLNVEFEQPQNLFVYDDSEFIKKQQEAALTSTDDDWIH